MEFNHIVYPRSLAQALASRASLAEEMRGKLEGMKKREDALKVEVLKLVPVDLKDFVEISGILTMLFERGLYHEKIFLNSKRQGYGFADGADVRAKLKKLTKAWEQVIRITPDFSHEEDGEIGVWFSAYA